MSGGEHILPSSYVSKLFFLCLSDKSILRGVKGRKEERKKGREGGREEGRKEGSRDDKA